MRRTYDVTGYLIEYDKRIGLDYRKPRDRLIAALEEEAPGQLVLPTLSVIGLVRCMGYSTSESRERGGYCTFEMKFIEYGRPGNQIVAVNTQASANAAATNLNNQAASSFADRFHF
jgi:prophage DNA circulation protein